MRSADKFIVTISALAAARHAELCDRTTHCRPGCLMTALEQLRHIKRGLAGNALKLAPYAAYELVQPTCNLQRYRRDAPEIPGIVIPDVFACQRDVSSPISGLFRLPHQASKKSRFGPSGGRRLLFWGLRYSQASTPHAAATCGISS